MQFKTKIKKGDRYWDLYTKFGCLGAQWAAPGTIWYDKRRTPSGKYRVRIDHLFGLNRTFMRDLHEYVYAFHIGRLQISWWPYPKEHR